MLNPEDPEVRLAVFGQVVKDFMQSEVGVYVLQCRDEAVASGVQMLRAADPYDGAAVRQAQNKIMVAEMAVEWLAEAIQSGAQALESLREQQ
jgi:hypothetical protein